MVEQHPLKVTVEGSNPSGLTILDIERELAAGKRFPTLSSVSFLVACQQFARIEAAKGEYCLPELYFVSQQQKKGLIQSYFVYSVSPVGKVSRNK